jgi:valyl-tRNA synthetase
VTEPSGPARPAEAPGALSPKYDPHAIEARWYETWERSGIFTARPGSGRPAFSIVIPPPNVTGSLHIGHALNNTLQDILCRRSRMQGYDVLWVPGCDHAGIATQNVVERELAKQKVSRHDLGRERFIERVWQWKEQYGGTIMHQLRKLGSSLDWSRERFTMDAGLSEAVKEVFVRLYGEGLIYRGDYIINWCPRCRTALSDIEVEHQDTAGHFWFIRYPRTDGAGEVVVATTRPETMLGDTAVAVNPKDERYQSLVGAKVKLPLMNIDIPVIADDYVDSEFGSGVVKITPAHDLNDFQVYQRHPEIGLSNVMNPDATMNDAAGPYAGLDRFEARKRILADLEADGYMVKVEDHEHAVGHCYRCHTVVEPRLSRQWFVKTKPLAAAAIAAYDAGKIEFTPGHWGKVFRDWLENIRDWCISRQIWWGHRIPAWYCNNPKTTECVGQEGVIYVGKDIPPKCPGCGGEVHQDSDVLDTWFSSGLWPFSTLGWPERTPELAKYYPTSVLVTSWDIIFFWVARMAMFGLKLLGDVPFHRVCINSLVGDAEGKKMSKSKGNTVDPLDLMVHTGADGLRFTMALIETQSRYVAFTPDRLESSRNFMNKIWNAARFALLNLEDYQPPAERPEPDFADRWIRSRLNTAVHRVDAALDGAKNPDGTGSERYRFSEAAQALYDFTWREFCDWYLELIKPRLNAGGRARQGAQYHLLGTLETLMKLFHPFIPFISEEIWSKLPGPRDLIMRSSWPQTEPRTEEESILDQEMGTLEQVIYTVRNLRGEMNVPVTVKTPLIIRPPAAGTNLAKVVQDHDRIILEFAKLTHIEIDPNAHKPRFSATGTVFGCELFIPLEGIIDLDKERERLSKEIAGLSELLEKQTAKLSNQAFTAKAPAQIVEAERAKQTDYQERRDKLQSALARLQG